MTTVTEATRVICSGTDIGNALTVLGLHFVAHHQIDGDTVTYGTLEASLIDGALHVHNYDAWLDAQFDTIFDR